MISPNTLPLVSVIMSVYNGEKYIREAVDSILQQSYRNFEFIIIEDASKDQTLSILQQYQTQDSRIKIIKKETNKGISGFIENLNIGLQKASGKYIARMDADDISHKNRLEKQVQFLEKNTAIFIVGSSVQCIDEKGHETFLMENDTTNKGIQNKMFKKIQLFHPTILFRNNRAVRYREKMLYCEDYDLYLRLMTENLKFANIKEPLLKYRILDHSISRKDHQFIKWLFVQKARQFYKQKMRNENDDYASFNPKNMLSILDPKFKNEESELQFALATSLRFNCNTEMKILLKKIKNFYPSEKVAEKYLIYLQIPQIMKPYFSKFFR